MTESSNKSGHNEHIIGLGQAVDWFDDMVSGLNDTVDVINTKINQYAEPLLETATDNVDSGLRVLGSPPGSFIIIMKTGRLSRARQRPH